MLRGRRILCLDVGSKLIGLALSDKTGTLATPLGNLERKSPTHDFQTLKDIIRKYGIDLLVVGLPVNMDGSTSRQTQEVADFIRRLQTKIRLPVKTWDERLSSRQAEKILLAADLSRRKRKKLVDKLSAQIILQSYLDAGFFS
jgi:putative Holliday junction resolvase